MQNFTAAQAVAGAPIRPDVAMVHDDPDFDYVKPVDKGVYCVLFVGDLLTRAQKKSATWRLGGKLFLDFPTVPNNIVRSCQITRLQRGMRSIPAGLVQKEQRELYIQSYTAKNVWNGEKGVFEDVEIGKPVPIPGMPGKFSDRLGGHLLFKELYPSQQIGQIAMQGNGCVVVEGLSSKEQIIAAQLHYFPNWTDILIGTAVLPATLRELESHIRDRQRLAGDYTLRGVGDAYLESCSQFRDWATNYVNYQAQVMKETERTPGARHDEIAERLFDYVELTRQDSLVKNFAQQANDSATTQGQIAEALAILARIASGQRAAEAAPAPATVNEAPAPVTRDEALRAMEIDAEDNFTDMTPASADDAVAGEGVTDDVINHFLEQEGAGELAAKSAESVTETDVPQVGADEEEETI